MLEPPSSLFVVTLALVAVLDYAHEFDDEDDF
jgi:hypothetical protein